MKNSRRQFIKAGVAGSAALACGIPEGAMAGLEHNAHSPLSILVLGGTGFIGPHMVREALRRGHSVTLFNRRRTNNRLFPDLKTIKGDRDGDLDGLKGRQWDAVIDNSGYVPRHVQESTRLLSPNSKRYLFVSSVSVYESFTVTNTEDSPLASLADETTETVTGETYGALKALCEKRAAAEMDADRLTIIRPTYICGPGDHTDRFSYWPVRTQKGGEMIWPGTPSDAIQIVDVRDLANFTIDCLDHNISGIFNAATPIDSYTMGDLLKDSQALAGNTIEPLWVGEDFAYQQGLVGGRALPIWHPSGGEFAVAGGFSAAAAVTAGLHNRPTRETTRDLLTWWQTLDADRQANLRAGIPAEREAELITALKDLQH